MPRKDKRIEVRFLNSPIRLREVKTLARLEIQKEYVARGEASKLARVDLNTLRRWHEQGKLRAVMYRKVWYYSREDLGRLVTDSPT